MKTLLASTTALALLAGLAQATPFNDTLIAAYQAKGFQRIEIDNGPTQVKLEAIRDGLKVEVVYDAATGAILSQETYRVDSDDDTTPGVEIDYEDEDFVHGGMVRDDDDSDDDDDDSDDDDDDDDDDSDDDDDDDDDDDRDDDDGDDD